MPRTARTVIEGVPYHVTQRGNRRQEVFFSEDDFRQYLFFLKEYAERYGLEILAYCLMTNHVHLVVLPHRRDSLARTMRSAHMRYSQYINSKFRWSGHLWQARYFSAALDEPHLWAAVRYVERNPVRAGLVAGAGEYCWSSAAFHLGMKEDKIIRNSTQWGTAVDDWQRELVLEEDEEVVELIRDRTHSGFPCGDEGFVQKISEILGRPLILRRRGRPRKG